MICYRHVIVRNVFTWLRDTDFYVRLKEQTGLKLESLMRNLYSSTTCMNNLVLSRHGRPVMCMAFFEERKDKIIQTSL